MNNQISLKLFFIQASKLWFLMLTIILFFSGCTKNHEEKKFTIGFSQCVGSDLWRKTMLEEMKMELSLRSGTNFIYRDANNSSKKQIEQVKELIDNHIDILIISPNEASPLTDVVEKVYNMGIPVIVLDRKTSSSQYTAYVGAENFQVGRMAGQYISKLLKGNGKVVEILGLPGSSPAMERDKGFNTELHKSPGIKLITQVYGNWIANSTFQELEKNKDAILQADAIFAHNDVMAASAEDFLRQHKDSKNIKVIGVDALPGSGGGLQLISDGKIAASVLYPTGGKEAISIAFKILNKETFSKENILQSLVIDSSLVQLMKLQWAKVSSQQRDIERQQTILADQLRIYDNQKLVLNVIVITLVLAVIFGGLAFFSLVENRKINKSLEQKNTQILDQRNKLIDASAKIEAATEAKLNFFTNISHEFRTPLTLILSPLEDLLKSEKIHSEQKRELNRIQKNAYRLLKLINELIDYRKLEHQKFHVHPTSNSVQSFLNEIVESFRYGAQKKDITLKFSAPKTDVIANFDLNIFDKIILNLLSNALKFTPAHGRINVNLITDDDHFIISVADNGTGMTQEELLQVWDQFYQSNTSESRGSGLGLSLTRELVHLHGGIIDVQSSKWQGSTFTITMPYGNQLPAEVSVLEEADRITSLTEQVKVFITEDLVVEDREVNPIAEYIKEYSILIIEDNSDLLKYLVEKFSNHYEVYTASTGNQGLNEAFEKIPDIIISDVIIPGMSGKEIAKKIKTDLRTSHIPLILLTAQGSPEQQIDGINSMADLYMTKPFHFDYLLANVKNLLSNRMLLKEHYVSDISSGNDKKTFLSILDKKFLNDFAGFVEHHLGDEKLSVDKLAQMIGISRIQLYRKVKALLNCSITDYILNRRLKKASYLLANEDLSISEIAFKIGISSPTYFSTLFKSKYGMSPTDFKKKQSY
ncbi:histidine kinase [Pedobacter sp. Leaf216]|uniref:substrate-binding domain-containing protein n=1 Tax=Pedobacter sp. Leaf216 TaxID=1735684 RepID=UPI0006FA4306|nr:substrate-binding domain-containing protein [Pedobacter sp. Leaf216]KQM78642.1 histidine kinase [Pedobacter sp. Leaf216]